MRNNTWREVLLRLQKSQVPNPAYKPLTGASLDRYTSAMRDRLTLLEHGMVGDYTEPRSQSSYSASRVKGAKKHIASAVKSGAPFPKDFSFDNLTEGDLKAITSLASSAGGPISDKARVWAHVYKEVSGKKLPITWGAVPKAISEAALEGLKTSSEFKEYEGPLTSLVSATNSLPKAKHTIKAGHDSNEYSRSRKGSVDISDFPMPTDNMDLVEQSHKTIIDSRHRSRVSPKISVGEQRKKKEGRSIVERLSAASEAGGDDDFDDLLTFDKPRF